MNPFYYISIIFAILLVACYLVILLQKPYSWSKIPRKGILLFAYGLLFSIFAASLWSEYELSQEVKRLKALQATISSRSLDSLYLNQEQRLMLLDSLKVESKELEAILNAVRRQEAIVGSGTKTIEDIYDAKLETQKQHSEIANFNSIISPKNVQTRRKGFHLNQPSSLFTFLPPQDVNGDYIDLKMYFHDESIISKIGAIYIEVIQTNSDSTLKFVDGIYYEPQKGINKFRLKNYFKSSNTYALIGFFWADDLKKSEYPTFESIRYRPVNLK